MSKLADNDYPVHQLIRERWSPRAFSDQEVEAETICSLLEAARWAPSCYNDQPWYFLVGSRDQEPETHDKIYECLVEANRAWAKNAPVLMLSVARKTFEYNGEPNRHALHDVGLAAENLVLEALNHRLYVHQMAGFDQNKARELFEIPERFEPVAGFAIGYLGNPDQLDDKLKQQELTERNRKTLDQFVFSGTWNRSSMILDS